MKFYLSSYKYGKEENQIVLKEWINSHGKDLVFISNAKDYKEDNEIKFQKLEQEREVLREIGFNVIDISLKDYFGKKEKLFEDFKKYNTFCLIGGNVFVLRKAFELSGFDKFLVDNLYNKDILYIGYSAGTCALGKTLDGLNFVDDPINIYNDDGVQFEGVGIFGKTFVPHYKSNHPESEAIDIVVEFLKDNDIEFITLQDGDVIIEEF